MLFSCKVSPSLLRNIFYIKKTKFMKVSYADIRG